MNNNNVNNINTEWSELSYADKNSLLFACQKEILSMFIERGAISREQHDKSLNDLIEKMVVVVDNYAT